MCHSTGEHAQDRAAPQSLFLILITVAAQGIQFLRLAPSSRAALSAEVLFLRRQLAFYQEHRIPTRKLTAPARFSCEQNFIHRHSPENDFSPEVAPIVLERHEERVKIALKFGEFDQLGDSSPPSQGTAGTLPAAKTGGSPRHGSDVALVLS
jgi:hypothetical protein